jgi:hypothetical protein
LSVTEVKPKVFTLEYTPEPDDPNKGECLWARFLFNLDTNELIITSDCGNYSHSWPGTYPDERSFLRFLYNCDKPYLLEKLYGRADVFDFEATKQALIEIYSETDDDYDKNKLILLNEILDSLSEDDPPTTDDMFVLLFGQSDCYDDFEDYELYGNIEYVYPHQILKIVDIFETVIKPVLDAKSKEV